MKKFLRLITLAIVMLTLSLVAVACGGGGGGDKKLAAPTALTLDNMFLSWEEVEGATGYEVSADGINYTKVDEAEVDVETIVTSTSVTKLYVRAIGGKSAEFPVVVSKLDAPNKPRVEADPETKSEKFVWDKVTDAKKYLISVNGGKWVVNSSTQFVTTDSGTYVIVVKCKSYSEDNYIYLESDPSEASDEMNLLVGSALMMDVTHTLMWDIGEFDSFNLWVDGELAATDIMPGVYDEELEGYLGFNFVEEGVITKTGEYDMQLECIKGEKSAWSNVLEEVGTLCINENEITTFDNRRLSINNVDGAAISSISTDIKRGEKGASLRIEKASQINVNLSGLHGGKLNLHTVEEVSYWVYLEKPEDVTDAEANVGYIPVFIYDAWGTGVSSQVFDPQNLNGATTVPWNTWFEVRATVNIRHDITMILKARGPYPVYIDDIYYTSLIEEPENAEELGLTSDKAIRFVKNRYTASYQKTTINLGEEFGGRDDVFVTMDVYLHTKDTNPFGLCFYSWQDGQINESGNHKGRPIGYIHYQTPSTALEIGQWTTITFRAQKLNENGDFIFSPGTYEDKDLGFSFGQTTFWIYVKNVKAATLGDVEKSGETGLKVSVDKNSVEKIELYINDIKVSDDISNDLVNGVYDLKTNGHITTEGDYFLSAKVGFVKGDETLLTSSRIIFEKLSEGVQVGYNPSGAEAWSGNKDTCRAIEVPIDMSKYDDKDGTTQWVNVSMEMKGFVGKNANGESPAPNSLYLRAYDLGVGEGKIKEDPMPYEGATSWYDAYTKTEWTTIKVRLPKTAYNGGLYLVPFGWPSGYSITVFVRNIQIDYDTLSFEKANPDIEVEEPEVPPVEQPETFEIVKDENMDAVLKIQTNTTFDKIELYINNRKAADNIVADVVDGAYDLATAGYLTGADYYAKVKLIATKSEETLESTELVFEKLSEGVQVGYNPNGSEPGKKNDPAYKAIQIPVDSTKFDSDDSTIEWVNVTLDIKGTVGVNESGAAATGGMYIRAYDWGVANGTIKKDPSVIKGADSWFAAYTATEWKTIQIRIPKQAVSGNIFLVPFAYPSGYPITIYVKNIMVDYDTISTSATSPVQYMENVGTGEVVGSAPAGTKAISVNFDKTKFAADGTLQWFNVTMKVRGTIGQGADGSTCTGGIYMRAYEWGGFDKASKIKEDPVILSGVSSWVEACSSMEWKEITVRIPQHYASTGYVSLHLFGYPTAYPISMEVKDIVVDYTSISTTK